MKQHIDEPPDDDAFDPDMMFRLIRPAPRVWRGCTHPMRRGVCDNEPIQNGLCYAHSIADFISGWRARRDYLTSGG